MLDFSYDPGKSLKGKTDSLGFLINWLTTEEADLRRHQGSFDRWRSEKRAQTLRRRILEKVFCQK